MRDKILLVAFIAVVALTEMFHNVSAQEAADKAQQILAAARAAIGGEKLKSLQSLSIEGEFRRSMGPMDMSGTASPWCIVNRTYPCEAVSGYIAKRYSMNNASAFLQIIYVNCGRFSPR